MGTTPRGLRYPEPTDLVTNGAAAIRSLAEDTDSQLTAASRHIGAKVRKVGDQSLTSGAIAPITWEMEVDDPDGLHDPGDNTKLFVPTNGHYIATVNLIFAPNSTGLRMAAIYQNAVPIAQVQYDAATGFPTMVNATAPVYASAGDYFYAVGYQDSGGNLAVSDGGTCWFAVQRTGD